MKKLIFSILLSFLLFGCLNNVSTDEDHKGEENFDSVEIEKNESMNVENLEIEESKVEIMEKNDNCLNKSFTHSPVNLDEVIEIVPLGNVAPPAHSIPTEHMYFEFALYPPAPTVEVYSPGDVKVTNVQSSTDFNFEGSGKPLEDYSIRFQLCDQVVAYYLHLQTLSPELENLFDDSDCWTHENDYKYCNSNVDYDLKSGELVGTAGGKRVKAFDFGLHDYRIQLNYSNLSRYTKDSLSVGCPLDYFDEKTKEELYSKVSRNVEPICGKVMNDIDGTLQGTWYFEDALWSRPNDWDKTLSFIPYNHDPAQLLISIGGTFTNHGIWQFSPEQSGTINREFKNVIDDGKIYCYETDSNEGRILVEMIDNSHIKIESSSKSCLEEYYFSNPYIYSR